MDTCAAQLHRRGDGGSRDTHRRRALARRDALPISRAPLRHRGLPADVVAHALSRDPRYAQAAAAAIKALPQQEPTAFTDPLRITEAPTPSVLASIVDSAAAPVPELAVELLAPPFGDARAALLQLVEDQRADADLATLRAIANGESVPANADAPTR